MYPKHEFAMSPCIFITNEMDLLDPKCISQLKRGDSVFVLMDGYNPCISIIKFKGKNIIGFRHCGENVLQFSCDYCNKKMYVNDGIYACEGKLMNNCEFHICRDCPKKHDESCKISRCDTKEIVKFPKWAINSIYKAKNIKKFKVINNGKSNSELWNLNHLASNLNYKNLVKHIM